MPLVWGGRPRRKAQRFQIFCNLAVSCKIRFSRAEGVASVFLMLTHLSTALLLMSVWRASRASGHGPAGCSPVFSPAVLARKARRLATGRGNRANKLLTLRGWRLLTQPPEQFQSEVALNCFFYLIKPPSADSKLTLPSASCGNVAIIALFIRSDAVLATAIGRRRCLNRRRRSLCSRTAKGSLASGSGVAK